MLHGSVEGQSPQARSLTWPDQLPIKTQHPVPYHGSKIMIHFSLKPELHAWGKQWGGREGVYRPIILTCSCSFFTRPDKEKLTGCCCSAVWALSIVQHKLNFHQKQTYMAIISGHWCYHWILQCKQAHGSDRKFNEVLVLEQLKRKNPVFLQGNLVIYAL